MLALHCCRTAMCGTIVLSKKPLRLSAAKYLRMRPALAVVLAMIAITLETSEWSEARRGFAEEIGSKPNYSNFSHSNPREHTELMDRRNCGSCHRRNSGVAPTYPRHKDCTGCHLVQFTGASRGAGVNPICTICHKPETINTSNPPTKDPARLSSFRAEFDHAQHLAGKTEAKPSSGCAACHVGLARGMAQSIPSHLTAHQICYECHSPGKSASNLSSCGVCHSLASYSPTSTNAAAYKLSFSHADHLGRVRLDCTQCHNVKARGLAQTRQVTSVIPVEHFPGVRTQTCKSCHDGRRSFGDADTRDCKRCHKRDGFRM